MRRFAISDIHGCLTTFKALLEKIAFGKSDILYILGDYVDRGPNSRGVIDYIWNLQAKGYQIHCTMGNHEQMLVKCATQHTAHFHGLAETIDSFGVARAAEIPERYITWMQELPAYLEIDGYLLVHAGFRFSGDPLADEDAMIWIRDWYQDIDKDWLGDRLIVHGHTPTPKTDIEQNLAILDKLPVLNIDAGCVFDRSGYGYLCALNLEDRRFTFLKRLEQAWS